MINEKILLAIGKKQILSKDNQGYWNWMRQEKIIAWYEELFKPFGLPRKIIKDILFRIALALILDNEQDYRVEIKNPKWRLSIGVNAENLSLWGAFLILSESRIFAPDCPYTFEGFKKTQQTTQTKSGVGFGRC